MGRSRCGSIPRAQRLRSFAAARACFHRRERSTWKSRPSRSSEPLRSCFRMSSERCSTVASCCSRPIAGPKDRSSTRRSYGRTRRDRRRRRFFTMRGTSNCAARLGARSFACYRTACGSSSAAGATGHRAGSEHERALGVATRRARLAAANSALRVCAATRRPARRAASRAD